MTNNSVGIAGAGQCSLLVFKVSSDATGATSGALVAQAITQASQKVIQCAIRHPAKRH